MGAIDTLIAAHCPNGVATRALGDLLNYEQPTKYLVSSTDYDDTFETPVLTAGKTFLLGYTAETAGIYNASPSNPVIIFDDFTTASRWVDFPFKAKSSAMKMLRPRHGNEINFKFIWFAIQRLTFKATTHARHWISVYSKIEVPVPPIQVQQAIAETLTLMERLQESLLDEETARRQQYEHYRDRLTAVRQPDRETVRLGDVAEVRAGSGFPTVHQGGREGILPFYKVSDMNTVGNERYMQSANHYVSDETAVALGARPAPEGTLIFPKIGAAIRTNKKRVLASSSCYDNNVFGVIPGERLNSSYLYHLFGSLDLSQFAQESGALPSIRKSTLTAFEIALPALQEQRRIASILDTMTELLAGDGGGIAAERIARREQFEHYRDRLLAFPERTKET